MDRTGVREIPRENGTEAMIPPTNRALAINSFWSFLVCFTCSKVSFFWRSAFNGVEGKPGDGDGSENLRILEEGVTYTYLIHAASLCKSCSILLACLCVGKKVISLSGFYHPRLEMMDSWPSSSEGRNILTNLQALTSYRALTVEC